MTLSSPVNIAHKRAPSTLSPSLVSRSISSQYGSLTDAFDFASRSPLTSALHFDFGTSPKTSMPSQTSYAYSSYATVPPVSCSPAEYCDFERDYCSNFSCCDMTLPDMHALVAHFEDAHVAVGDNLSTGLGLALSTPFPAASSSLTSPTSTVQSTPAQVHVPRLVIDSPPGSDSGHADLDFSAAPSPLSSAGPETPPASASDANCFAYGFPNNITNSVVATMSGLYSPTMSGMGASAAYARPISPSSSFSSYGSSSACGSPTPTLSQTTRIQVKGEEDVLMNFDPLDVDMSNMSADALPTVSSLPPVSARLSSELAFGVPGVAVGVDSTPPSPLARHTRPASVLRAAAVAAGLGTSVGLPPALFTSPASSTSPSSATSRAGSPGANARGERSAAGPMRRERSKKGTVAMSAASVLGTATLAAAGTAGGSGHGIKRSATAALIQEESAGMETVSESESTNSSSSEKSSSSSGGRRQQREKAYKCPKPGCTKSYLNPNGLKYHASKGTCTFAVTPAPSSPTTSTSSTALPISPSGGAPSVLAMEPSVALATAPSQPSSSTTSPMASRAPSLISAHGQAIAAPRAVAAAVATTPVMVYAQAYTHPLAHTHVHTQQGRLGYSGMATSTSASNLGAAAAVSEQMF